jgi:hypothetical protein
LSGKGFDVAFAGSALFSDQFCGRNHHSNPPFNARTRCNSFN